jgi:mono/diheme cytochrome c family protein
VRPRVRLAIPLGLLFLASASASCRMDMQDPPRYEPDAASSFFPDGRANRPAVAGAVSRGSFHENTAERTGLDAAGQPVAVLPVQLDAALLERGRQRYDIYCSPCHSRVGDGDGMIVQRGYRRPTSFHDERLRNSPVGHFFDAITRGFGVMPSYASQIPVADRWAIVAYVRALQLSQNFPAAELPPPERARLDAAAQEPAPAQEHAEEGEGHG